MDSRSVRVLAEENLALVLERAKANGGRITADDAPAAQLFCRVIEAETNGGAYGVTTYAGLVADGRISRLQAAASA